MNLGKSFAVALAALLAILLCRVAWCQEGEADPAAAKGRPFRPGAEGRPGPGLGGPREGMMPGMDIPAAREEIQRHMAAMRVLITGQRDLAQQVAAEAKALRDKQTPQAEIDQALAAKFGAQADALAATLADELAKHHEALAKLFKENREQTLKQLAQSILRRMANREAGPRPPFEKGERPFPKDKGFPPKGKDFPPKGKDAPPENF